MLKVPQGAPRLGFACALLPASGVYQNAPLRDLQIMACVNMGLRGGMAPNTSTHFKGASSGPVRGPRASGRRPRCHGKSPNTAGEH